MATQMKAATVDELIDAHSAGKRFLVTTDTGKHLLETRSQVDRLRKENKSAVVFYVLPDGSTRLCARGKRLK